MTLLWICALIVVTVFAVMIWSIATFRRVASPASKAGALIEILWAIVPIAIMVSTALPALRGLTADDARTIQAQSGTLLTTPAASYNADRK